MDGVTCPKCNSRANKRGFETFATPPHKRQKYSCKECGHIFVQEPIIETPTETELNIGSNNESQ